MLIFLLTRWSGDSRRKSKCENQLLDRTKGNASALDFHCHSRICLSELGKVVLLHFQETQSLARRD